MADGKSEEDLRVPLPGATPQGRYEIIREIARGGMAVIYLAWQPALHRQVALKRFALRTSDSRLIDRFIRESQLAGSLSHSNIVETYDFFERDGVPYIAMEYLPCGSLDGLM